MKAAWREMRGIIAWMIAFVATIILIHLLP
jgi:hypothetical protein